MYGKIFEQIYDSTVAENWKAMITFQQLIVLADKDGVVDMTPNAIHRRTNIPLEIIEEGLSVLSEPDLKSRNPYNSGRRIELLDEHRPWGWLIVNYDYYREIAKDEQRKAAIRARVEAHRRRKSGK